MDPHTLEKLEFDRVRELLAGYARCALGRTLALRLGPSRKRSEIEHWLEQLRQFRDLMAQRGMPPFGGIRDVRDMIRKAEPPSPLEPPDFAAIGETLAGLAALRAWLDDLPASADRLHSLHQRLGDFSLIAERIRRTIDEKGRVRDDASEKLERIRGAIARAKEEILRVFDRLLQRPEVVKYLQYANATFHDDRMVLPLRTEQRGRIPGIIHRSSDSGQTLFVEPAEAVSLNNTLVELGQDEQKEIGRILWQLAHLLLFNQAEILRTLDAAAVIDLLTAKTLYADAFRMAVPMLAPDRRMLLAAARHPLLLALRAAERKAGRDAEPVVPIDIRLGDDFDLLVVTGPNTGGKTAALKTTGLLAVMALSGLAIPAATGATVPLFDDVLIDVGDEQSLQQSLSTFSAHLARIMDVLKRAGANTLVLLDELGAGTDPDEGAALGYAIVDELLSRGCMTIVTTHLGVLKSVAFERDRAENAAVQFDHESLKPTYELRIGEPGESNALRIARRLGLPRGVLQRAEEHLAGRRRSLSRAIRGTVEVRRKAEEARRVAEEAARRSTSEAEELRRRKVAMEEQQQRFARWMECIQSLRPGDKVKLKRFDREGVIVRVKLTHQQVVVAVGAMEYEVPLSDIDV
ncbi:MAG: DNA strand exchange inhibitor protein [Phycisphaerae bacterium]|nr:DNA strand exchange inhibitor protein [Phycisphaerae bacterium]NUQ47845.1 DNA strand exchange inhibitor protein [Phycisphaerae bacterium]